MSETEVLDKVEQYIRQRQPQEFQLNVVRQGVRHEGNWWYVVVQPVPPDISARTYQEVMEEAEEDMDQREHVNVLLLPNLPGD